MDVILGYSDSSDGRKGPDDYRTSLGKVFQRVILTVVVVVTAMVFPHFGTVDAFVGSFTAFVVNIIFPMVFKVAVKGRCGALDGTIIAVSLVMAIWGTFCTFTSGHTLH